MAELKTLSLSRGFKNDYYSRTSAKWTFWDNTSRHQHEYLIVYGDWGFRELARTSPDPFVTPRACDMTSSSLLDRHNSSSVLDHLGPTCIALRCEGNKLLNVSQRSIGAKLSSAHFETTASTLDPASVSVLPSEILSKQPRGQASLSRIQSRNRCVVKGHCL